ncbi:hypothetical protein V1512DRAFT_107162 [Lipomyces arxii]|uniref:uncharacterized protein n=1 Tax=Lipomyces arxii TaxID=56418 RepID=UPI0034CE09CF
MPLTTSRRRSGFFSRPKSMVIDTEKAAEAVEENRLQTIKHGKRWSGNRSSASTVSSTTSRSMSTMSLSSNLSDSVGHQRSPTSGGPTLVPSIAPVEQLPESTLDKNLGSSPTTEWPSKRDIFGRLKLSLDRRKMPWSPSKKNLASIAASEPQNDLVQLKDGRVVSSIITKPTSVTPTRHQTDAWKEKTNAASTLFSFNSSKRYMSLSPPSSVSFESSSLSSPSSLSSARQSSSPTSSVSSSSSPASSPTKAPCDFIPATINEDALNETTDSERTSYNDSADFITAKLVPKMELPDMSLHRMRLIPRGRRHNNGTQGRPQTVVGFFRQSRIFSGLNTKTCNVFGMSLREATMLTRLGSERTDSSYWTPSIVPKCIEYLNKYGLHEEGLYRVSGSMSGVEELKKEISFYGPHMVLRPEDHDVHAVASLLKSYIRSLPEELVIPSPCLFSILRRMSDEVPYEDVSNYLSTLPVYVSFYSWRG